MNRRQGFADLYAVDIDRAADATVYRQIYGQLRSAILSGALRAATKLPSSRALAEQLGVSRSAVVSAFEQLLAEGYTISRKGAGTFVASDLPAPFEPVQRRSKRSAAPAKATGPIRDLGEWIDVTAVSKRMT